MTDCLLSGGAASCASICLAHASIHTDTHKHSNPNSDTHTGGRLAVRTDDGLHDALDDHRLEVVLTPAELLGHVRDDRVRVRVDL